MKRSLIALICSLALLLALLVSRSEDLRNLFSADDAVGAEPRQIVLGETVTLDFLEFTIGRAAWLYDILPPDTSTPLFRYLPGTEGERRLVLFGEIRNLTGETLEVQNLASEFLFNNTYAYAGRTVGMLENMVGAAESSVAAGETREVAIYASIPDALAEAVGGAVVHIGFDEGFSQDFGAMIDIVQHHYYIVLRAEDIEEMAPPPPEPVSISFGERVVLDFVEFTIARFEWAEEILPPDTSGTYRYFPAQEGARYLVLYGSVMNISNQSFQVDHLLSEFVINDELLYHGQTNGVSEDGRGFTGSTAAPGETREIVLFVSVPAEVADGFSSGLVTLGFDDGFGNELRVNIMDGLQHRFSLVLLPAPPEEILVL